MAIGQFLLRGEKLYSDIYTNHLPVTYIMSSVVQKFTQPNSLPMLVKRHRESVLVWSFIWAIFLILRFGPLWILSIIPYELTKHLLIGNIFLAESFAVYPCIYLTSLALQKSRTISMKEYFFVGMNSAFLLFSLLPLTPFVFGIIFLLFFKKKLNKTKVASISFGFITVFALVVYFSSMNNYYRDAIYANIKYYIPSAGNALGEFNFLSFFSPLIYLITPLTSSFHINLIKFYCFLLVFNFFILILFKKKYHFILVYLILGLSNLRSIRGLESMSFHLLVWYGLLIFVATYTSIQLIALLQNLLLRKLFLSILIVSIGLTIWNTKHYFISKVDRDADAYVNFSVPFDYGEAVRIMKKSGDRMFAIYNGSLIYWQSGIDHALPYFIIPGWRMFPLSGKKLMICLLITPQNFYIINM